MNRNTSHLSPKMQQELAKSDLLVIEAQIRNQEILAERQKQMEAYEKRVAEAFRKQEATGNN